MIESELNDLFYIHIRKLLPYKKFRLQWEGLAVLNIKFCTQFYSERKIFYCELLKRDFFYSKKANYRNRYTT